MAIVKTILEALAVIIIFGGGIPAIVMTLLVLAHVPLAFTEEVENEDS